MTEMYVSFSVKSSDFGYKLTHFRRDFVKSGVTTLARGNCNVCFNYFVRGFRARERGRERDSCAYLLRSMGICDGSKYSLVGICYLSEYLLPYSKYGGWVFATRGRYLLRK